MASLGIQPHLIYVFWFPLVDLEIQYPMFSTRIFTLLKSEAYEWHIIHFDHLVCLLKTNLVRISQHNQLGTTTKELAMLSLLSKLTQFDNVSKNYTYQYKMYTYQYKMYPMRYSQLTTSNLVPEFILCNILYQRLTIIHTAAFSILHIAYYRRI